MSITRFSIFSVLFALATCSYYAQLRPWIGQNLDSWALIAALSVLLKPSSVFRFLLLVLVQTAAIYVQSPWNNTNRMVAFFAGVTILATVPGLIVAGRGRRIEGEDMLAAFEPLLRLELLIIYIFTFWHKLNLDFINPHTSCGVALYRQLVEAMPGLPFPAPGSFSPAIIIVTLLVEGGIPLLLMFRCTRNGGVILGLLFHFVLGIAWFYSFSATMTALLFLFTAKSFANGASDWWKSHAPKRSRLYRKVLICLVLSVAFLYLAWFWETDLTWKDNIQYAWRGLPHAFGWWLWWLYVIPIAAFIFVNVGELPQHLGVRAMLWPQNRGFLIFPLCVVLNGLCPYLGLKTESSFAMYSNLRTEGGRCNHLIIRKSLALVDYQIDLVRIIDSSDESLAKLAKEGHPVPFYVVRRRISERSLEGDRDIAITYIRSSITRQVAAAENDPDLSLRPNYFELKFLRFRKILIDTENACAH